MQSYHGRWADFKQINLLPVTDWYTIHDELVFDYIMEINIYHTAS